MSPVSGVLAPDSMRMKVDLPAPLAPTRPCTPPVSSTKLTLRNARTPANDFETLRTRMASVDSLIRLLPIGDSAIAAIPESRRVPGQDGPEPTTLRDRC